MPSLTRQFRTTPSVSTAVRRSLVTALAAAAVVGCGDNNATEPTSIAGTYSATIFRVTPNGASVVDVLAQGGALTLGIAADNSTSGTLSVPASVTGGAALMVSMAGTAVRTGNTVQFQQAADTFVRDLIWTVDGNTLRTENQAAGAAGFTVELPR